MGHDFCLKKRSGEDEEVILLFLNVSTRLMRIAFGFLTNITTGGLRGLIPMEDGYSFAYGMGAVCMAFAVTRQWHRDEGIQVYSV